MSDALKADAKLKSDQQALDIRGAGIFDSSSRREPRKSSTSTESDASSPQAFRRRIKQPSAPSQKFKRHSQPSHTGTKPHANNGSAKVKEIEDSLNQTLKSIISYPTDYEIMLETVFEDLHELREVVESLETNEFTQFYQSKIGQYLVVIQRVVHETFGHIQIAKKIDEVVVKLLHFSSKEIINRVSDLV